MAVSQNLAEGSATPALATSPPGQVWLRQASIYAGTISGLVPGNSYSIPVSVNVLPGYSLSGLQFRATLVPNGNAPTPGQIQFNPRRGPSRSLRLDQGLSPNDIICAWSLLQPFNPPLQGSNALGSISFQVPPGAQTGQSYTLQFSGVDGVARPEHALSTGKRARDGLGDSAALTPPQISSTSGGYISSAA